MSDNTSINYDVQFVDKSVIRQILSGELPPKELRRCFWFDLCHVSNYEYWDRERNKEVLSAHTTKNLVQTLKWKI